MREQNDEKKFNAKNQRTESIYIYIYNMVFSYADRKGMNGGITSYKYLKCMSTKGDMDKWIVSRHERNQQIRLIFNVMRMAR